MATTPNYGWVTPAPTDFVTDLPADFETFADAVDADLAGLLGGTTGQLLAKDSNADHDFSWINPPSAGAKAYTLLNTGGTALTGAQEVTVSGISARDDLMVVVVGASSANASALIQVRFNADTANNYRTAGPLMRIQSTYTVDEILQQQGADVSRIDLGGMANAAGSVVSGTVRLYGASGTGPKPFIGMGAASTVFGGGNNGQYGFWLGGVYLGTSAISSVTIRSSSGNLDAGTVYVYGAA